MKESKFGNSDLPPLHSTAEKRKDSKVAQWNIKLKSFSSIKNNSYSEWIPASEMGSKREFGYDESQNAKVGQNIEKASTATPNNFKSLGTKTGSIKIMMPPSRKSSRNTQVSINSKVKRVNMPRLSIPSESNITSKEGIIEKDLQEESISKLEKSMKSELLKCEKEIDSFRKEFENLVESCMYTITQKYKKLAWEISKTILNQDPEVLINSSKCDNDDSSELISCLSGWIQNWQRDSNNFEYQFNFFKNRLISLYNTVLYKMPNINVSEFLSNFEEEESRENLREMLQSMTGVIFENSVPLSEDNTQSGLAKVQGMVNSLRLSKILTSNEQRSNFSQKILVENNYQKITPLWGKMIEENEDISAEEFHENWDKMGPILLLIKTKDGWIFGGASPQGFDSINNYSGSEYAFLFSYATSTGREPIICKIKPEKASFAVKNNEKKYSPGFGKSNKSDLFISFKNLSKSYSHVGTVYEFPTEAVKNDAAFNTPETFMAGSATDWQIENIEAFSIWA